MTACLLLVGLISAESSDATPFTASNGNEYEIIDGKTNEVCLTKWNGTNSEVNVYETITYDGKTYLVTEIGNNVFYGKNIKSAYLLCKLRSIGDYAFCNCSNLSFVNIPNTIESIGEYAFCGCDSLTKIQISKPSSVTSLKYIGTGAFKINNPSFTIHGTFGTELDNYNLVDSNPAGYHTLIFNTIDLNGNRYCTDLVFAEDDAKFTLPTICKSYSAYKSKWVSTDGKSYNPGDAITISENTRFSSQYLLKYNVTFRSQDGKTVYDTISVEKGGNVTWTGETPTKNDTELYTYTFVGWNSGPNSTTVTTNVLNNITSNKNVYAAFSETAKYLVVFKSQDGKQTLEKCAVKYDGTAVYTGSTPQKNPTDQYIYKFAGWNTKMNQETGVDKIQHVTSSVTVVYAAFSKTPKYPVTFWSYDGSEKLYTAYVVSGGTATYYGDTPTKASDDYHKYQFVGWNIEKNKTYKTYNVLNKITGAKNVYAAFSESVRTFTITFNSNGGTAVSQITKAYGATVTEPAQPTKIGCKFVEWRYNGEKYTFTTMPNKDITLSAKWSYNNYTITFDSKGGSYVSPITQEYGEKVTEPAKPTKTGCTFNYWVYNGNKYTFSTMPPYDITLTALWTTNSYTITFDTDGGSKIDPITQAYNTDVKAPAAPTKDGYVFDKWQYNGKDYTISKMPDYNITLKAVWKTVDKYSTITYQGFTYTVNSDLKTVTLTSAPNTVTKNLSSTISVNNTTFTVTAIGSKAFKDRTVTVDLTIPNTVKTISARAFYNCDMKAITITGSVSYIPIETFMNSSCTSVTLKEYVKTIGENAFSSCTKLTKITAYNGIGTIEKSAFKSCTSLKNPMIGGSVGTVGDYAFYKCTALTQFLPSGGVQKICKSSFESCSAMTSVYLKSCKYIGDNAFNGCKSLNTLNLPGTVKHIGTSAFANCTGLTEITIDKGVTGISSDTFSQTFVKITYTKVRFWLFYINIPVFNPLEKNDANLSGHTFTYYQGYMKLVS